MEDFWQNVRDITLMVLKAFAVLTVVDLIFKFGNFDMRIPIVSRFVESIFYLAHIR